ncbi:hypothetical protein SLEP1_g10903 [Rubroshorea leprosula]|uniref:Uncharacterized protein n=1 Tax=Rubroshorea leprosula TaxID=152421 RepID=A0AAV5IHI5_9ROSI|nr:hypothetical protein SLEP1_g10903 [Rubroshorea leprosula]
MRDYCSPALFMGTVYRHCSRTDGQQLTGIKCLVCDTRTNVEIDRNSIVIRGNPNDDFSLNL